MTTATITADDIVRRHAVGIAFVAGDKSATDLGDFIDQLDTAARNFRLAGINGHEDLETAATLLSEAPHAANKRERNVFLRKADKLLKPIPDMTDEYRSMVGD